MTDDLGPESILHARLYDQLMHTYTALHNLQTISIRKIFPETILFRLAFYPVNDDTSGLLPTYPYFDYGKGDTKLVTEHGIHAIGQALCVARAECFDQANVKLTVEDGRVLHIIAKREMDKDETLYFYDTVSVSEFRHNVKKSKSLMTRIHSVDSCVRFRIRLSDNSYEYEITIVSKFPENVELPLVRIPNQDQFPPEVQENLHVKYGTDIHNCFRLPPDHHCHNVLYMKGEHIRQRILNNEFVIGGKVR